MSIVSGLLPVLVIFSVIIVQRKFHCFQILKLELAYSGLVPRRCPFPCVIIYYLVTDKIRLE